MAIACGSAPLLPTAFQSIEDCFLFVYDSTHRVCNRRVVASPLRKGAEQPLLTARAYLMAIATALLDNGLATNPVFNDLLMLVCLLDVVQGDSYQEEAVDTLLSVWGKMRGVHSLLSVLPPLSCDGV